MTAVVVRLITVAFVFGGSLFGIYLRVSLPKDHFGGDSKDVVKLGMGLVGMMAALVLGLLIASAKASHDTQSAELTNMSSKIALLDRVLACCGPESKEARDLLHAAVARTLDQMGSTEQSGSSQSRPSSTGSEVLYDKI